MKFEDILNLIRSFDVEFAENRIIEFILDRFNKIGAKYAVIGVSGGIDSALVLGLLEKALGKDKVLPFILPHGEITENKDIEDAENLIKSYGSSYNMINIDEITEVIKNKLKNVKISVDKKSQGNMMARIRSLLLYTVANIYNGLVIGTGDKSEILIGYFTKYGDGAVDILPIGDLYKTQVRILAKHIGIPDNIVKKPSSPNLWKDQTAEEELGLSYEVIDVILYAFLDLKWPIKKILELDDIEEEQLKRVLHLIEISEHKRMIPIIPKVSKGLTVGLDWRMPIDYTLSI